jgi:hypothetical protein
MFLETEGPVEHKVSRTLCSQNMMGKRKPLEPYVYPSNTLTFYAYIRVWTHTDDISKEDEKSHPIVRTNNNCFDLYFNN